MTPYAEQLASIRSTADFFASIDESDHGVAVANCPGWSVGDVIRHMAWQGPAGWIAVMEGGDASAAIAAAAEQRPSVAEALGALCAHLEAHEPTDSCRGFFGPGDYAAWGVHCSVETALHRVDVADALGTGAAAADLSRTEARDGLRWSAALLEPMATVGGEDAPAALTIQPERGTAFRLGRGEPAASATGGSADVVLWLWGRGRGGVTITGDGAVADAWASISGRSFQHEAIR